MIWNLFVELYWMLIIAGIFLALMTPCCYFLMRASSHLARWRGSPTMIHPSPARAPPETSEQAIGSISSPISTSISPSSSQQFQPQISKLPRELARKLAQRVLAESKPKSKPAQELSKPFDKLGFLRSELESGRISPEFISQQTPSPRADFGIEIQSFPLIPPDSRSKLERYRQAKLKLISRLESDLRKGNISRKSFQEIISKLGIDQAP